MRIGGLEAGGTKMVCAIGDEMGHVYEVKEFPTMSPEVTMPNIINYFKENKIEALGIGAFGPVDLNKNSKTYGYILDTPKLEWKHYNFLGEFKRNLDLPMGLDTDVNVACLGEVVYGQGRGLENVIYITVGTGIGVGIYSNGKLLHGMLHPEAGHILIQPIQGDEGNCICPYHNNCFEGLASGPSIQRRWNKPAKDLVEEKKVWELESKYIGQAVTNYILTLSPEKIILGGGVMKQEQLFSLIREEVLNKIGGYINTNELINIDDYIVPAKLEGRQGIMGALYLGINP